MHWCPACGWPCWCDSSDTDYGELGCNFHNGEDCRSEEIEDYDEFYDEDECEEEVEK
jgi:hypothetical protein